MVIFPMDERFSESFGDHFWYTCIPGPTIEERWDILSSDPQQGAATWSSVVPLDQIQDLQPEQICWTRVHWSVEAKIHSDLMWLGLLPYWDQWFLWRLLGLKSLTNPFETVGQFTTRWHWHLQTTLVQRPRDAGSLTCPLKSKSTKTGFTVPLRSTPV